MKWLVRSRLARELCAYLTLKSKYRDGCEEKTRDLRGKEGNLCVCVCVSVSVCVCSMYDIECVPVCVFESVSLRIWGHAYVSEYVWES